MIGNISGSRGLLSLNISVHQNMISSTAPRFVAKTITRSGQIEPGKQERAIGSDSEHSTVIWDQQGRPVEGIIVPKSGHATAYVERFVHVILRNLGPFALRIGEKHSVWCILFVLRFYGPVNPMGSCRARSVYLTTRLLGRLSPLSG